jgi:hypothetical protein
VVPYQVPKRLDDCADMLNERAAIKIIARKEIDFFIIVVCLF